MGKLGFHICNVRLCAAMVFAIFNGMGRTNFLAPQIQWFSGQNDNAFFIGPV